MDSGESLQLPDSRVNVQSGRRAITGTLGIIETNVSRRLWVIYSSTKIREPVTGYGAISTGLGKWPRVETSSTQGVGKATLRISLQAKLSRF